MTLQVGKRNESRFSATVDFPAVIAFRAERRFQNRLTLLKVPESDSTAANKQLAALT
jgi:hypothetical protein